MIIFQDGYDEVCYLTRVVYDKEYTKYVSNFKVISNFRVSRNCLMDLLMMFDLAPGSLSMARQFLTQQPSAVAWLGTLPESLWLALGV